MSNRHTVDVTAVLAGCVRCGTSLAIEPAVIDEVFTRFHVAPRIEAYRVAVDGRDVGWWRPPAKSSGGR